MALVFITPTSWVLLLGGLFYLARARIFAFSLRQFDRATFSQLKVDALRMSGYQVAFTVSSKTDMVLIGIILGSAATVDFGVAYRIFSLVVLMGYANKPSAMACHGPG